MSAVTATVPALVQRSKLPFGIVFLYGLPAAGLSLPNMLLGLYFFKFATDVLYVAPGVLGLVFGLSRLWDAVSDPVAGYYSDRTQARMGRRRPWMLVGAFVLAISTVLLWAPPASLQGLSITLWVTAGLVLLPAAPVLPAAVAAPLLGVAALAAALSPRRHLRLAGGDLWGAANPGRLDGGASRLFPRRGGRSGAGAYRAPPRRWQPAGAYRRYA